MVTTTSHPGLAASMGIPRHECADNARSLFVVDTADLFGTCEYASLVNDLVRMTTIYVVAHYLTAASGEPSGLGEILLLVCLGVAAYWLIINKIVTFV